MNDSLKLRLDIQALRGLAVLIVVLYHAKIGSLDGGYLGVDIFFVISGFLITTLVASGIEKGTFRLSEFYFRRAKRLLPAAYVTFLVCVVVAPWFLNQQELRDFAVQLVGAVTFTGNFVLWQQTDYFQGDSNLKPLLHVWSLAIEEQYYFLLPTTLLLIRRSRWLGGVFALILVSLSLCVAGMVWKPVATFYLLPTRAWELLLGSAGALLVLQSRANKEGELATTVRPLFIPSVVCLLVLPFFPFKGDHPGLNAFLVCLATLVLILSNNRRLNAALPVKLLARIGDFSYSLYLVHWPIFAFMKNAWVGKSSDVPLELRFSALVLSFVLSYLLYQLVEDPIRKSKLTLSKPLIRNTALASLLLASVSPITMYAKPTQIDFKEARKINYGFSKACEYENVFTPKNECRNSETPSLLVWGDSYAMHLIPGLEREWKEDGGVIQATRSQCGPFLGLAPRRISKPEEGIHTDQGWAERCIAFNQSVIEHLRATPSIKIVVLSSPFSQYLSKDNYEHVIQENEAFISVPASASKARSSLLRTINEVRALGKKVVVIAPPPSSDFNIGGCLERQLSETVSFGGRKNCVIDRKEYLSRRADVLGFLDLMAPEVSVIKFDPWLCNSENCSTLIDNTMIYRDSGHFSHSGSVFMAERMHIGKLIRELAN